MPGVITTRNPFFYWQFPGSVTYLKLMKSKGLDELCAATSDLANQIGIETSSRKGTDRSPESNVPRSICPKTLCSLSPTPLMLHIQFDQDWPTGFRDIQVQKCEMFVTQGQVTPKWVVWFCLKSNSTDRAFMPVLVTSNFDDDLIKNEQASMERSFSHYQTMGFFLDAQGQLTP